MKALVLGGSGFIGRRLVQQLLNAKWEVTVATSGKTPIPFGTDVTHVKFDRFDREKGLQSLASRMSCDVLFDQLCFDAEDADSVVENFGGKIERYVFVSSGAVYTHEDAKQRSEAPHLESEFDARSHDIKRGSMQELGYSAGKRNAEAFLFQKAPFPVAAARFPIVIGHDDSTGRFQKCIGDVLSGGKITLPPGGGKRNFVWVDDAGRFLSWLAMERKEGSYNAASSYSLGAPEIVERITQTLDKHPEVEQGTTSERSPFYYAPADAILTVGKAEGEGFKFTPFGTWFPSEVKLCAASLSRKDKPT